MHISIVVQLRAAILMKGPGFRSPNDKVPSESEWVTFGSRYSMTNYHVTWLVRFNFLFVYVTPVTQVVQYVVEDSETEKLYRWYTYFSRSWSTVLFKSLLFRKASLEAISWSGQTLPQFYESWPNFGTWDPGGQYSQFTTFLQTGWLVIVTTT